MSPAHVLEPTYSAIKRQLMEAHWPMGTKLEAARLADDLGVSITPVRDSLNRLFGEHLVDFIPGEGFRVPVITEGQLRDLFDLQRILLTAAISSKADTVPLALQSGKPSADFAAYLFLFLASRSANEILIAGVASINDRLHLPRSVESEIFEDTDQELAELANATKGGSSGLALLKGLLPRYFERRVENASLYIRWLSAK